jgi:hypothetical protein
MRYFAILLRITLLALRAAKVTGELNVTHRTGKKYHLFERLK